MTTAVVAAVREFFCRLFCKQQKRRRLKDGMLPILIGGTTRCIVIGMTTTD